MSSLAQRLPRITMLHCYNDGTSDYRIWKPARWLEKQGLYDVRRMDDDQHLRPIPIENKNDPNYNAKFGTWDEAGAWTDAFHLQRIDSPEISSLMYALRERHEVPLIGESDDNMREIPKFNQAHWGFSERDLFEQFQKVKPQDVLWAKSRGMQVLEKNGSYWIYKKGSELRDWSMDFLRSCDAITVATPELKERYSDLNPDIFFLNNCQDFEQIQVPQSELESKQYLRIGWIGSITHYEDVKVIERVVPEILDKYPHVEFIFMGADFDFFHKLYKKYPGRFSFRGGVGTHLWPMTMTKLNLDIGLAPLVDIPFNRCKSELKWMEYASRGVPTVASSVAPYMRAIEHGVDGFLCGKQDDAGTKNQWVAAISQLIENDAMRKDMGQRSLDKCLKDYNFATQITRWADVYDIVIEKYKKGYRKKVLAMAPPLELVK